MNKLVLVVVALVGIGALGAKAWLGVGELRALGERETAVHTEVQRAEDSNGEFELAAEVVEPTIEAPVAPPRPEPENLYYQWVDNGRVRFAKEFGDVPPEWRERVGRVRMDTPPPMDRRQARETRQRATAHVRAPRRTMPAAFERPTNRVAIYTTRTCGYCRRAMAYLDEIGQPYTNYNVDEDPEAREEYLEKTGGRRGVPVIDVNGKVMQGWNQQRLDQLLGRS